MKLDRREIARILGEISTLLQIKGENPFKSRAYDIAKQRLEGLTDKEFETIADAGRLTELPGIGEAIAKKIAELHQTGTLPYYEELRGEFPPRLRELMAVEGLGPKKIAQLHKELGVGSVEELKAACEAQRVRTLKGFSAKGEAALLTAIAALDKIRTERRPLAEVRPIAEALLARTRGFPGVQRAELAGSVRRFAETVGDVDVVVSADDAGPIMDAFAALPGIARVLGRGDTKLSAVHFDGLQVDLRVVPDASFATALHHFTGSKAHHIRLRGHAQERGLKISEYAIERVDTGERLPIPDEQAFYAALGLSYVPPELREDHGEFEAALEGRLPKVVDASDVQGIIHAHTTWSDGKNSVLEMAKAARAMGMRYLTITDHSARARYAGGLDSDQLKRQWDEIDAAQEQVPEVLLLKGTEVDILEDGSLDFPDAVLEKLDIVIMSIHERHKMDEEQLTKRVLKAMDNPYAHVWGHPTGRLIGKREPAALQMEKLLDKAAEKGLAVEVNGNPDRLDLSAEQIRLARERGVKLVLSTDAHSTGGLAHLQYSVATARRGWVGPSEVLNTLPAPEFRAALQALRA